VVIRSSPKLRKAALQLNSNKNSDGTIDSPKPSGNSLSATLPRKKSRSGDNMLTKKNERVTPESKKSFPPQTEYELGKPRKPIFNSGGTFGGNRTAEKGYGDSDSDG